MFLQYLCWWTPSRLTRPCLRGFVGFPHLAGSFSSLRAFAFPPSPAGQASPAVNLLGEPHALANPLRSRANSPKHGLRLEPTAPDGTRTRATRTIPSRTDLPAQAYSIPSTRRQARRISCNDQYHSVQPGSILGIVRTQIRAPCQAKRRR